MTEISGLTARVPKLPVTGQCRSSHRLRRAYPEPVCLSLTDRPPRAMLTDNGSDQDLLGLSGKKSRTGSHPELQCLPAALSGQPILLRNQLSLCERSLRQSSHAPVDWNAHGLTTIRRLADDHFLFRLQGIPQQPAVMVADDNITDTRIAICPMDRAERRRAVLRRRTWVGGQDSAARRRARSSCGRREPPPRRLAHSGLEQRLGQTGVTSVPRR